jgi:hypothetical protein
MTYAAGVAVAECAVALLPSQIRSRSAAVASDIDAVPLLTLWC